MKTKSKNGHTASRTMLPKAKDAIAVLQEDHAEARSMLKELSESSERAAAKRGKILAEVGPALWVHMQIEEEIFYPAFEAVLKTPDDEVKSFEARAEHRSAKAALTKLESCDPSTTEFRAMAKVVHDLVDHHATEEEEEMFPRVKKLLGKEELTSLGQKLMRAKEQLLESGSFRRGDAPSRKVRITRSRGVHATA
jgi:hemerythrin-like domain-containing protein